MVPHFLDAAMVVRASLPTIVLSARQSATVEAERLIAGELSSLSSIVEDAIRPS
jgi:hypothetical protein